MSIVITDLGSDVQFAFSGTIATENFTFNKSTMRVKQGASLVYVTNSDSFNQGKDNKVLELSYDKVTSPVYISNDALYAALKVMIDDNASSVDDRSYDEATDSDKVFVLNPVQANYTSPEHLINLSAQAASAGLYYVIPAEGFKDFFLHLKLASTNAGDTITVKVYETANADADDTALTDWVDSSTDYLGAATKSVTGAAGALEEVYMVKGRIPLKILVEVVLVGATTTKAVDLYLKKAS